MKKVLIVLAIVVAMTFAMTATAFADHSPNFYVEWDGASTFTGYAANFGNAGTGSPHQNYLEGTEKCGVCHSVHRAPVYGVKWDTNPAVDASKTAVAGGQYDRAEFDNTAGGLQAYSQTQMLLQSSVANSCDYCHILTSVGGKQLYAGKPQYRTEGTGLAGAEWDAGFAHHNGCTGCHAVHGVASNYGDSTLWGAFGTFQGPLKSKVLKLRAKGSGGAVNSLAEYAWQDETIAIGSAGKAEFAASGIAGAAAWAGAQTAQDYTGANKASFAVDPLNVPLFPSPTDAIMGTNVRPGTGAAAAQSGVFCTFCHVNYGYASEATVNPDADRGLFQGPWYALAGTVPNVTGAAGTWQTMNGATGYGAPFKNHPVKSVYGTFTAAGKGATVPSQVAFTGAETCVSCHDAGASTGADGVLIQSYPHFTPGYFHFTKSAAHVGAAMTNAPAIPDVVAAGDTAGLATVQAWLEDPVNYEEAVTVADGQCLKCHVNAGETAGVGINF
jgi:hypothetical protein